MKDFSISDDQSFFSSQNELNNIRLLIGETKYNELFNDGGLLYDFNTTTSITVSNEEKTLDYLLELIEMLNNADIEVIEVYVE